MNRHFPPIDVGGDLANATLKSSPGVAVTVGAAAGLPIEDWLAIATLVFVVLQILYLLHKWVRETRAAKKERSGG